MRRATTPERAEGILAGAAALIDRGRLRHAIELIEAAAELPLAEPQERELELLAQRVTVAVTLRAARPRVALRRGEAGHG